MDRVQFFFPSISLQKNVFLKFYVLSGPLDGLNVSMKRYCKFEYKEYPDYWYENMNEEEKKQHQLCHSGPFTESHFL